jgi:hypothetical protein
MALICSMGFSLDLGGRADERTEARDTSTLPFLFFMGFDSMGSCNGFDGRMGVSVGFLGCRRRRKVGGGLMADGGGLRYP